MSYLSILLIEAPVVEDSTVGPLPAVQMEVPFRLRSHSVPAPSNEHPSIELSQATTNVASGVQQSRHSASLLEKSGHSVLQQSLEKIMAGLAARRRTAGRPDDPMVRHIIDRTYLTTYHRSSPVGILYCS